MARPSDVEPLAGTSRGASVADADAERHVHIVLLGLMGSGKSTTGRIVANELGRPFVDSDSIVELRTGHLPPALVEVAGVEELHHAELEALRQVVHQQGSVVYAAAASVVDHLEADDLGSSYCVWLDASPDVLAARVVADDHDRPLLGDRPVELLSSQHESRAPRGRELAALTVDTDDRSPAEVAAEICNAWRDRIS